MNIDEFRAELESEIRNASFNSGQSFAAAFVEKNFKMLEAFVDAVLSSDLEIEESTSIAELADIKRIFAVYSSLQMHEPITINFANGLPCLRATNADNCESFLCVIPGKTTILNKPEMFFAFNNGIAATAKQIEFQKGGQTTASLLSARLKDKADLEKIFVQMKLMLIGDMQTDAQEKLIGEISRSSNSQNKVSETDFFSTPPFLIEMEKISRRIFVPLQRNLQYVQEQIKLTTRQKNSFQRENPKAQVLTKTDFAKYRMSWHSTNTISRRELPLR